MALAAFGAWVANRLPLPPRRRALAWQRRLLCSGSGLEVVRLPRAWQRRLEEPRRRPLAPTTHLARGGRLMLRSRRPELNQAARQTVGRWELPRLVSTGWKNRQSRGDYFLLERRRQEPPQERELPDASSPSSFAQLGVEPQLASALQEALGISQPTPVQKRTIPTLLAGSSALCAAETGSGKTLAYLLPLLQGLRHGQGCPLGQTGRASPRSLVVVPSRELAGQVRSVAARLAALLGLQVREVGGGRGIGSVKRQCQAGPPDLLVATPGVLCKALRRRMLTLEKLLCLVLDEVDTLLDPSFIDLVGDILQRAPLAAKAAEANDTLGPRMQLVAMGATLPKGLRELLGKVTDLGGFSVLTSHSLHRLQPHVEQKFLRLKGSDKASELLQLIKDRGPSSGALLVFCNSASTVNWLGYILDDHRVKHLRLQGQMPAAMRAGIFDSFQKGQCDILVCTDITSRGLDTTRVELVVNYDFPPTLHDYLHRVGRVGRVGSNFPGTVISFVTHRWDVDLVQKIETAARKRAPLPGMEPVAKQPLSKGKNQNN
ncbi:probable ATP-dependent RNA helicase DDX28 [Hemicordylus capensis]|uniref:probable ATP-dependent RNA helicase DDX28 n=1 Tax=Hemicordylus capensis TaxID=884348 RepID=UPI0023025A8B|nr:probable ATP-dependent RNA helicase DDX28 [Hemicordylus capensis]